MSTYAFAVEHSQTTKLGLVHATYATQKSCPASCVFQGAGCYAEHGVMALHTRRLNDATPDSVTPEDIARQEADAILDLTGRLDLRIHVVGDCRTTDAAHIVAEAANLVQARRRNAKWTYTHAWRGVDRRAWEGVSVLASCEHPWDAVEALDKGWTPALVVPEFPTDRLFEDDGVKVLPCPGQTRNVQCVDCRLCFDSARLAAKGIAIGFAPHGTRKTAVRRIAEQSAPTSAEEIEV